MLFINGYHVDDAAGIQYRVTDTKNPIYGYNDVEWRTIVRGRSIVQGSLEINYLYPGYLTDAIQAAGDLSVEAVAENIALIKHIKSAETTFDLYRDIDAPIEKAKVVKDVVSKLLDAGVTSKVAIAGAARYRARKYLEELKDIYWAQDRTIGNRSQPVPRPGNATPSASMPSGFAIVVRYGNSSIMGKRMSTALLIEDVNIDTQSQIISADVPDGGAPIREAYSFVARRIIELNDSN